MVFKKSLFLVMCLSFYAMITFAAPVTMRAVDADVRALLSSVAHVGNLSVVIDQTVSGKVTANINGLEPKDALYMIAKARGFTVEDVGGTFIITDVGHAVNFRQIYTFPVQHAELETIKNALQLAFKNSIAKSGNSSSNQIKNQNKTTSATKTSITNFEAENRVMTDAAHGAIIFYGTQSEAEKARALIASLDTPPKQISLMAKVLAIQKDASKDLGVEWRWSALPQYPESRITYEYEYADDDSARRRRTSTREYSRSFEGSDNIPGIIRFGRGPEGYPYEFYYEAKINALITDGKAKVLSQPNITTLQGKEAVINIGGSVPVPIVSTTNSTVTTSIQYRNAGIILRYTPRASNDGYITADVHTEVSSPLYVESLKAYRFQERSADTTVRLRNNETMVIGGLIGEEESKSFSKVPFLGDIPILGALFKNNKRTKSESELMIFLTAKVLEE